jgi:hypothetical protein
LEVAEAHVADEHLEQRRVNKLVNADLTLH